MWHFLPMWSYGLDFRRNVLFSRSGMLVLICELGLWSQKKCRWPGRRTEFSMFNLFCLLKLNNCFRWTQILVELKTQSQSAGVLEVFDLQAFCMLQCLNEDNNKLYKPSIFLAQLLPSFSFLMSSAVSGCIRKNVHLPAFLLVTVNLSHEPWTRGHLMLCEGVTKSQRSVMSPAGGYWLLAVRDVEMIRLSSGSYWDFTQLLVLLSAVSSPSLVIMGDAALVPQLPIIPCPCHYWKMWICEDQIKTPLNFLC